MEREILKLPSLASPRSQTSCDNSYGLIQTMKIGNRLGHKRVQSMDMTFGGNCMDTVVEINYEKDV
jgi:hypothetical protein